MQKTEMWTWGEGERGGGMNWETGIDIYILPWVRQIASGSLMDSPGSSAQCSLVILMGGIGEV